MGHVHKNQTFQIEVMKSLYVFFQYKSAAENPLFSFWIDRKHELFSPPLFYGGQKKGRDMIFEVVAYVN